MRPSLAGISTLVLALTFSGTVPGTAQTRRYLFQLSTKSGDPQYAGEIPVGTVIKGGYADVDRDEKGRITRVRWFWNGKSTGTYLYHFSTGEPFPDSYDHIDPSGVMDGTTRITRNASHEIIRYDYLTATGGRTGYSLRTIGSEVERTDFSARGQRTARYSESFSTAGLLIRSRSYPEDTIVYESEIDELTGESKSRRKTVGGHTRSTNKYTYDSYGDLTRDDIYNSNGKWYGARQYSGGLLSVRRYTFENGTTEDAHFFYDENRRATQVTYHRNGRLICTFKYDRLPNGAIRRTLAIGPDGAVLANYPDIVVNDITRDGHPVDQPEIGIIYKQGDWW